MKTNIVNIITTLDEGGAEATLFKLAKNSNNLNYKLTVISLMDIGKYGSLLKNKNVNVITLNMNRGKFSLRSFLKLYQIIKKINPDVVQTWLYHADFLGGIIAKLLRIKIIIWNIRTSEYYDKDASLKTKIIIKLNSILSHFIPNKIVYCSYRSINIHERIGYAKKSYFIPNGYDLDLFREDIDEKKRLRIKYGIEEECFVIGFVSRFHPIKNHELLIDAVELITSKHKNIKCIFVGKNIKNNKFLQEKIIEKKIENFFIFLDGMTDIYNFMNIYDLHILPSKGEGFPNVIAETMSCGVINISTDVGDAPEILLNKDYIFEQNKQSLSDLIIHLKKLRKINIKQWEKLKKASIEKISNNYSLEKMCKKYYELWNND